MNQFWSSRLEGIRAYTPGEQPIGRTFIKLNTNENPYPPAPNVEDALRELGEEQAASLRLYPDPASSGLSTIIAARNMLRPSQVFLGNGSDEVLCFCFMAFMDAQRPAIFPDITYSFYPVYAQFTGVPVITPPLQEDFSVPVEELCQNRGVVLLANPNAPTGRALPLETIEEIVRANPDYAVIIDEAYIDFGGYTAASLIHRYENLLVVQTFSKSRALAGMRVGYALGQEPLIDALRTVRDCINSYTIDRAAQRIATASMQNEAYFRQRCWQIVETRERTAEALTALGFHVVPSEANFLFVEHPAVSGETLYQALREAGILVRRWDQERIRNYLRISIGTDEEMDLLLAQLKAILAAHGEA